MSFVSFLNAFFLLFKSHIPFWLVNSHFLLFVRITLPSQFWRPSSLFQCRLRITIVADKECNLSFCNNFFFLFYVFLFNWNLEWFTYINKSLKAKSAPLFLPSLKKGKLKLYNSPLIKLWKQRRLILHTRKFGYNFQIDT